MEWAEPGSGAIRQCRVSKNYALCQKIRQGHSIEQKEWDVDVVLSRTLIRFSAVKDWIAETVGHVLQ